MPRERMNGIRLKGILTIGLVGMAFALGACAGTPEYPIATAKAIEQYVDFRALSSSPQSFRGRMVHLAGEILRVEPGGGAIINIYAQRKRLLVHPEYPGYRPDETVQDPPDRFLLVFHGKIDPDGSRVGNKFVAVAEYLPPSDEGGGESDGKPQADRVNFVGHCLHVWKTGVRKISFFVDRYTQMHQPLEDESYCDRERLAASR